MTDAPTLTRQPKPTTEVVCDPEKAEEPPKMWRNLWRARYRWKPICRFCGGETHYASEDKRDAWGCRIWPSKEVAETAALEEDNHFDTYLGAFPWKEGKEIYP